MTTWTIRFKLNRASHLDAHREEDGIRASVQIASDALRVENIPANSEGAARAVAEPFANQFLDTLAYKHDEPLQILPLPWASKRTAQSGARVVGEHLGHAVSFRGSVALKKIDAQGNVVEAYDSDRPGSIEVKASEAAPYYRRGSLSADPFDQFRNFYLVAENVADQIRAPKQPEKPNEQTPLSNALARCFADNTGPLLGKARVVPGFTESGDAFKAVAKLLYKAYRCQLAHAKAQESKKVPFNPDDEKTVKKALPLMRFVAKSLLDYEGNHLQQKE